MRRIIKFLIIFIIIISCNQLLAQEISLAEKLSGYILLQVEQNGEAWYVNPDDTKRYFLNRPSNAFQIMNKLGIGITNQNLSKIPIGIKEYNDKDNDSDGLTNRLEISLNTDPNNPDSDNDGFSDYEEITNSYNPNGTSTMPIDMNFTNNNTGKIFLQVEQNGEAWYVNPVDKKRYYLSRPQDAFLVMKELSLGITDESLTQIAIGQIEKDPSPNEKPTDDNPPMSCPLGQDTMNQAAAAIRANNMASVQTYFADHLIKRIEVTLNYLEPGDRLIFGNTLSGAKLISASDTICIFEQNLYFSLGDYNVPVKFYVEKQEDESWKITNL